MKPKTKILVVDDDRRMAKTICDILRVKGFEVQEVNSGEVAIGKIKSETPDCVLMDIKMDGIDGIETLKIIKSVVPDLPVVLMSAYATEEQARAAKKLGAYSVLGKPIDIQGLLSFLSVFRKEKSILIVDDDPKFSQTLKDILESRNYKVETEANSENVINLMEQEYKLVVLLDMNLGSKDGAEVLRDIRQKYPTKPVILITGYGKEMKGAIDKGFEIGAYACLYKPFEIDTLVEYIEDIDRKKLQSLLGEKIDI
jgi:two-component system, NtrC family, response regulator HydG